MPGENKMTQSDAARIQSQQAKSGADTGAGSFPARAQSAGDKNANQQGGGGGGKASSGGNQGGNQGSNK